MRIIFMGSPQFSVPSLHALASNYNLVGVVTQPDRPAGRGKKLHSSQVKVAALDLNLKVLQPKRLRDEEILEQIQQLEPELIVVAAFGQILPQKLLDIPSNGCINVHASLLPRWRGAAPIQASILHGDDQTGISIMLMDAGVDTGPVLSQKTVSIQEEETAGELSERLSHTGASLLLDTIPGYITGEIIPVPQDDHGATYAPMIKKSEGELDFNQSATQLSLQVRAFEPWPTSFFLWNGKRIVVKTSSAKSWVNDKPGRVILSNGFPSITTSDGILVLEQVQPAGRKPMPGDAFLRGSSEFIGAIISKPL